MPLLNTDKFGVGPLYDYSTADRNALLNQGVTYFQTDAAGTAIQMDVFDATFICAGTIASNGVGVKVLTNDGSRMDVTGSGHISTEGDAIAITAGGRFTLTNAGMIVSTGFAVHATGVFTRLALFNTGTIESTTGYGVFGSDGGDLVTNTGTIIGVVSTGGGSDTIDTHLGEVAGRLAGGDGFDTYVITGSEEIFDFEDDDADSVTSYGDYALASGLGSLTLAGFATNGWGNELGNTLTATDRDSRLYGRAGNDALRGGDGDDVLKGGDGDDYLVGLGGDNQLYGGRGNDSSAAFGGNDLFDGGDGDDTLQAGAGSDTFAGGTGRDIIHYVASDLGVTIDLAARTASGGYAEGDVLTGVEDVWGTSQGDSLTGSKAANELEGFGGDDSLIGLAGDDTLIGDGGADLLDGGDGIDTARYDGTSLAVTIDLAAGIGTAGAAAGDRFVSVENLIGTYGADSFTGSSAANVFYAGTGDDTVSGGGGNDTLYGQNDDDTLSGGGGKDVFGYRDLGVPGGWGTDQILDFENGKDKISFVGASEVHSLADLEISTVGGNVFIATGGEDIVALVGFDPKLLDASDFIFDAASPIVGAALFRSEPAIAGLALA